MRCVGWREEACLGLGGLGINVGYQSKSDRLSPLDRQITTPENQASRLSLIPPTPLSKGLVTDFFVLGDLGHVSTVEPSRCSERLKYTMPVQAVQEDNRLEASNHARTDITGGLSRP